MIIESPVVENFQRNISFPSIVWLEKSEYVDAKVNGSLNLYPAFEFTKILNEKLLIGKNVSYLTNSTKNVFIGYVNSENDDNLKIATNEKKVVLTKNYYILCFSDSSSFNWIETINDKIPKYALRSCLNYNLFEYFYIGRTLDDKKYIGNICRSDGLLYICNEFNEAKSYSNFEILCLKPSPTSLKQLCSIYIRQVMSKNGFKESSLEKYLPKPLIDFLKYPSFLCNGECLLKNEKLVSENGLHELKLTENSKLEYFQIETEKKRILYDFVESIWINKYFSVINRYDNAFVYFLYLLDSNDINDKAKDTLRLELTNNGQLILHQNGVTFKKYFIHE